ncbi:MAG: glycosyltransferase, partial [Gallionella sp.]
RPVYAMTLPVTVDLVSQENRAYFGLPENDYLFVLAFDFNSVLSRKNPAGVIQAFQRAFPLLKRDAVGLVIKTSHASGENKEWKRIKAMIKADPRIHLIDVTLRRPQVLALYRCCDCYVSLHRSEGFGRSLAEALLLDKQLIATGFSGNMDYCTDDRVYLVHYNKQDLRPSEYFHGSGQYWAEPDINHAAQLMQQAHDNPKRVFPNEFDFSPTTVGARYAKRLHEIKHQLDPAREDHTNGGNF